MGSDGPMQGFPSWIDLPSSSLLLVLLAKATCLPSALKLFPQVGVDCTVQPERGRRNLVFLLLLEVGQAVAEAADEGGSLLVREGGASLKGGGQQLLLVC